MERSQNTVKAVGLLNAVISDCENFKRGTQPNHGMCESKSAMSTLDDLIGEMDSITVHGKTSVECLGRPSDVRGPRLSVRRGASREIADTVTGALKRPEDESSHGGDEEPTALRPRENSRLRRGASQDLASTVTGDLKRPEDEEKSSITGPNLCDDVEGDYRRSPRHKGNGLFTRSESIDEESDGFSRQSSSDIPSISVKQYADDALTVNYLDLRVGKILSVSKHDSAEKLYCESIDVGEPEPRSIASGLVPYYSLEEMQGRMVVVVCNLKPRNLVGFASNGMVLCATSESGENSERKVELLTPPVGSVPGDRVFASGVPGEIVTPQKCDKKKIFPKVAVDLKVDECGRLMWDGILLSVGGLPQSKACTAPSLRLSEVG